MNSHMESRPVFVNRSYVACPACGPGPFKHDDVVVPYGPARLRRIRLECGLLDACDGQQRYVAQSDGRRFAVDPWAEHPACMRSQAAILTLEVDAQKQPFAWLRRLDDEPGNGRGGAGRVRQRCSPIDVGIASKSWPWPRSQCIPGQSAVCSAYLCPSCRRRRFGAPSRDYRRTRIGHRGLIGNADAPAQFSAGHTSVAGHDSQPVGKQVMRWPGDSLHLARYRVYHKGVSHESL